MKIFLHLLFIITIICPGFSQHLTGSDNITIKKNNVKASSSWFYNEEVKNELDNISTYDKNGNITSFELIDAVDTTKDIELFIYKGKLLVEEKHMGTWQTQDTLRTVYLYNTNEQLLKKTVKGGWCSYSFTCLYDGNLLTNRVYEKGGNCFYDDDSLIYDQQNKLTKILNSVKDVCIKYTYNSDGQLASELKSGISDTNLIYQFANYHYLKGKLVKEDAGDSKSGNPKKLRKYVYRYYYYDSGLLKEIKRLDNDRISYYNKFTYTFY